MQEYYYKSPIGILKIVYIENRLYSLSPTRDFEFSNIETDFTKNIKSQLDEYFIGKRTNFDIKLNPQGTDFQKKVWQELIKIPYGKTKSYSDIAEHIGNKNALRAVGTACNKNPILIIIPCHRVISKNGKINGFAYGINMKEKLINLEKYNNNLFNIR